MGSPDCIALVQEATKSLGQRQFHDAVALATKAIRLDPKHAPAYVVRAVALRKLNRLDRALSDITMAIRLEPDRPTPYVIRAEIFKGRCELDRAIDDATQAISLDPNNAAAFEVRGACRSAIGDVEGAVEDQEEVFRIDPTRPPTLAVAEENPTSTPEAKRRLMESGRATPDAYGDLFADGKPADETYRSLNPEEAARILGRDSRYKPEIITTAPPRTRASRTTPGRSPWPLAILASVGMAILVVIVLVRRASDSGDQAARQVIGAEDKSRSSEALNSPEKPVPAPAMVPAADWINLLPYIDPSRDSFGGKWSAVEGGLISPEGGSLLHVSYPNPSEYRLRLRLMKGSEQMVGIGLVTGRTQHLITIDSYPTQGCFCKFDVIDGESIAFHQGKRVLPMHEVSTVICTVRRGSIVVECNGQELGRWEGDFGRLSVHPSWAYGPKTGLFIASVGKGSVVKGLDLLPLSEGGTNEVIAAPQGVRSEVRVTDGGKERAIRSHQPPEESVKLMISMTPQDECRIVLGRSIPEDAERKSEGLSRIMGGYSSNVVGQRTVGGDEGGTLRFEPTASKLLKTQATLIFPRAIWLPGTLSLDILDLRRGSVLGLEFFTPTMTITVYVESDDELRKSAVIRVHCITHGVGGSNMRLSVERTLDLAGAGELRFRLPPMDGEPRKLLSLSIVLNAYRHGKAGMEWAEAIGDAGASVGKVSLKASGGRTLGMQWKSERGVLVVKGVLPDGLANGAGIAVGDEIVGINDGPCPIEAHVLATKVAFSRKLSFRVRRGGKERVVAIVED